jgi:shikimate dehydrogenase
MFAPVTKGAASQREVPRLAVAAKWKYSVPSATLIEKCCLIASPVAGNPTQYLVEHAFSQQGLDWRFMSFEVEPERLGDAMRGVRSLGFHGIKIGEPFHQAAIEHLDELTAAARQCGTVNCVTARNDRLVGDNTEGAAAVELVRQNINPVGRRAMVLGSGRVARAIALALAEAGMTSIAIASRNAAAGQELAHLVQQQTASASSWESLGPGPIAIGADTAVLVNATSLGTARPEAELPLKLDSLSAKTVVAEVAYNVARTRLTQQAAERGCRIIDGLSLYVQQTALALRAWTGAAPDSVAMREAAEEFLGI